MPDHYSQIEVANFIVMPNHVHFVIIISAVGAGLRPARTSPQAEPNKSQLPEIVRALKSFSSRGINKIRQTPGALVWQRNYYEHIIRNEDDLNRIREYIEYNPARWAEDEENPARTKS